MSIDEQLAPLLLVLSLSYLSAVSVLPLFAADVPFAPRSAGEADYLPSCGLEALPLILQGHPTR